MKRPELLSRILITMATVGAIVAPLYIWARTPLIHAKVAENGGWSPDIIKASAGEPLNLKLTSDDVMHGFAVGQMDMDAVDVEPGKVVDLTLTFEKPGTYTFYCTRWCGLNHWRMRGTIEVTGASTSSEPVSPPLYVSLKLDIDAPHDAAVIPNAQPSAIRGQEFITNLPIDLSPNYYRTHSPYQVFENLNRSSLAEQQRWDVVTYLWQSNTTRETLATGKQLYTQNCAACHGETGAGNGIFADELKTVGELSAQTMSGAQDMQVQTPANFTDSTRMLGASPALLQGKILRGGMGTGMPMWGSIFTEDQIWDLIAYIYSFQFEYHN